MEIHSRNTNTLQGQILLSLQNLGVPESSRNGPVLRFPEPVTICLSHPEERVNLSAVRDCNPFFHLMEALAMLGAVNDAPFLAWFAKNMLNYSDDGFRFNAFYGWRLRRYHTKAFPYPPDPIRLPQDQLDEVIQVLTKDPLSRQAVALLWDPADLMFEKTKDKACNLMLVFCVDRGRLRMTSYNRSNDAVWGGVMGANIVHLSMFQEYVALSLGLPMGEWWHHSNNLHVYTENEVYQRLAGNIFEPPAAYPLTMQLFPGPHSRKQFDYDLAQFLSSAQSAVKAQSLKPSAPEIIVRQDLRSPFIRGVAMPVFNAWQVWKATKQWSRHLNDIGADDWRAACSLWVSRRLPSTPATP